jgi:four helix bundle protein
VIRDFRDLQCWQLSYELAFEVIAFTDSGQAAKDFKYRDQIRDSSASAPRNIAEGFGRFAPKESAQYLRWARASIVETQRSRDRRSRLRLLAAPVVLAPVQPRDSSPEGHDEFDAAEISSGRCRPAREHISASASKHPAA